MSLSPSLAACSSSSDLLLKLMESEKMYVKIELAWDGACVADEPACPVSIKVEPSCPAPVKVEPSCPALVKVEPSCPVPVKVEPSCPVPVKVEPSCPVPVKVEPSCPVSVKGENSSESVVDSPSRLDAIVKLEPLWSNVEENSELYAGHAVKEELELAPEVVERGCLQESRVIGQAAQSEGPETYHCQHCGYTTDRYSTLAVHVKEHSGQEPYDYEDLLGKHLIIRTEIESYQCDRCTYTCTRNARLQAHIRSHIDEKPHKCNKCSYASAHRGDLIIHKVIHTPYRCGKCSYACTKKSDLLSHKRRHAAAFKCDHCSYACDDQSDFIKHEKGHAVRPQECEQCKFAATYKYILDAHEKIHKGLEPYNCDQCSYAALYREVLQEHERMHTCHPYSTKQ